MRFVNTNPFRSTEPKFARIPPEDVLVQNDNHLRRAVLSASVVICAWGIHASPALANRAYELLRRTRVALHYLELSKAGIPKHPLYLGGNLRPTLWLRK